ncbi:TRAP transporter substrate-binding protein [Halomonas heilongjiangensis]|uniref:C4-dicarboxylate ABC transporter substrate-binding protein n=1 Tax=Halomonas heilongjiangensis TaxID=1387883 RepID=A0A2N7TPW9_9GAMM|nr:TRAP transporter substrate-binding protein [Halomonas heilongjiangensis]PMR70251.1 C4-dicarboxylate ABC transporter substrate-binding protein [Halomonas heilongjiangensis]PXX87270.1 C4-dicarboxylate ABC transporter substrate-binding protein [Halomonas heilongjiangensis]
MTPIKTLVTAAVAVSLSVTAMTAQARDFRLGLITPPAHLWTQAAENFAAELAELSDGQHSVSVFPSQQLGNEAQMVQQLQAGSLDMAFLTIAEISNRVPDFGALYAPYLVENVDQAAALLRSETAIDLLEQLPARAGLVGVGYGMAGMRQVLSRSPIDSAGDLRGKKLRITPFDPIRDFYLAAGTAPTPLPLPAVYDALANGQVDAIDMDFDSILILKFYEQADNLLISNHMMFPMVGVVSGRVWRELGEEDRALIQASMNRHLDGVITAFQQQDADQEAELRGLDIHIVDADDAFFGEVIEAWEATWAAKAPSLAALREAAAELASP